MSVHINEDTEKVIEIIGTSSKSFDDAILQTVNRASKTEKGITEFDVINRGSLMASVEDGTIKRYNVNLKLAFPFG